MIKKNVLIASFLILLVGTAFIQYKNTLPEKKVIPAAQVTIKQTISYDGKHIQSPTNMKAGTTALQLLRTTHKVATQGEKENAFITSIDDRVATSENREFWAFYVNGKQATVGAGSYYVKNNDTIEWKIETY